MAFGNLGLNKTSINQLAQAINGNQVTAQSGYFKGTGGTIIGTPMKLNSSAVQHNPRFLDIKTGPAVKYIHVDSAEGQEGKEYPSLYIYLGTNLTLSLAGIYLANEWVCEGSHPQVMSYLDAYEMAGAHSGTILTYYRNDDGTKGDQVNSSGTSVDSLKSCELKPEATTDGWYELPCTPLTGLPLYGVCFAGAGNQINFAIVSVPELVQNHDQDFYQEDSGSPGLKYSDATPLLRFDRMVAGSFKGLIGQPIKMYGLAPSPKTAEQVQVLPNEDGDFDPTSFDVVRIYDNNNTMLFQDQRDNNIGTFKPLFWKFDNEKAIYKFILPLIPNECYEGTEVDCSQGEVDSVSPEDPYTAVNLAQTTSAQDFTAYTLNYFGNNGEGRKVTLFNFEGQMAQQVKSNIKLTLEKAYPTPLGLLPALVAEVTDDQNPAGEVVNVGDDVKSIFLYVVPARAAVNPTQDMTEAFISGFWLFASTITPNFQGDGEWRLIPKYPPQPICVMLPSSQMGPTQTSSMRYEEDEFGGDFWYRCGYQSLRYAGQLCPSYKANPFPALPPMGDTVYCLTGQMEDGAPTYPSQTTAPGMVDTQWGSVELRGDDNNINGYAAYGIYKFHDLTTKQIIELPDGVTFTQSFLDPRYSDVVVRVNNTSSSSDGHGAHVEYIKLTDLANYCLSGDPEDPYVKKSDLDDYTHDELDPRYWLRGGDAVTNYGSSFKLGAGNSWITVSYEQ